MKPLIGILMTMIIAQNISADLTLNKPDSLIKIYPTIETGILRIMEHQYRTGLESDGNKTFDYVKQGGQEILYPFTRFSVDVLIGSQNTVTFLYQPLTIESKTKVGANSPGYGDLVMDGITFTNGSGLNLKYGFDFWRLSWMYDFFPEDNFELSAGLSLQFRNASIIFESSDGTKSFTSQNLGPVPILKLRSSYKWENGVSAAVEVDGFYASSAFFNGDSFPFTGYIWDGSLRAGYDVNTFLDMFLNLRFLGGGGSGTSDGRTFWTESASPTTYNHLSTFAVTLGARLK